MPAHACTDLAVGRAYIGHTPPRSPTINECGVYRHVTGDSADETPGGRGPRLSRERAPPADRRPAFVEGSSGNFIKSGHSRGGRSLPPEESSSPSREISKETSGRQEKRERLLRYIYIFVSLFLSYDRQFPLALDTCQPRRARSRVRSSSVFPRATTTDSSPYCSSGIDPGARSRDRGH